MLRKVFYVFALIAIVVVIGYRLADKPIPKGEEGPRAEFLADKMLAALNYDVWQELTAIKWSYPFGHHYIWDKKANLVQVKWSDYEVIINTVTKEGFAFEDDFEVKDNQELLDKAYEYFANDSFWLIAPYKVRDPGTTRKALKYYNKDALLVRYDSGGVTPGDTYLWILDKNHKPIAWQFWVSILPVGGIEFTWENWENVNGAEIATFHDGLINIEITNVDVAPQAAELNRGIDPFKLLR